MNKNKKIKIIGILVVIGISVCAFYVYKNSSLGEQNQYPNPEEPNIVNLGPPTEEEKKAGDAVKERIVESENPSRTTSSTKNKVYPVIVDVGQYSGTIELRAYIQGAVEAGGDCKVNFTKDGFTLTKSTVARPDATTTSCTKIVFNDSELPTKGTWSAVVEYNSTNSSGTSEMKTFEVR